MYVFQVMKKEWIHNLRESKIMLLMTVMPLVIILIMGIAIAGVFTQDNIQLDNITIDLFVEDTSPLSEDVHHLLKQLLSEDQLFYSKDQATSLMNVENRDINALIHIKGNHIELYYNDEFNIESSIIQTVLSAYVKEYNMTMNTGLVMNRDQNNFVTVSSLSPTEELTAMSYYGIAMSIVFIFYGVPLVISSIIKEKNKGTLNRILLTPVNRFHFLVGKTLGNIIISILQMICLVLGTLLIFDVSWGSLPHTFILLTTMIAFMVAIGVLIGVIFDSEDRAMGVIHVLIVITSFLGGTYMPLNPNSFIHDIGKFVSPIWWNMQGLLGVIYGQSFDMLTQAIVVNCLGALVTLMIAAFILNRKVVLNA